MNVLVTGGGGFIGSHLVEGLVRRGHVVRILDNFSTGKRANLAAIRDADGAELFSADCKPLQPARCTLIEGTIVDADTCRKACDGIEFILHHGAVPSVPESIANPANSHRANVEGTFNLLMAARDCQVRRVIYAASSSAYGESEKLPKVESMPTSPLSPYAVQKLAGENYCSVFSTCYNVQTLSLRYFNVFGPRQDPKSQYAAAIPAFVTSILKNEPPTIYGDGEQTRDFTYIENVVVANLMAMEAKQTRGEIINIACGEHVTVNQIIQRINEVLGRSVRPNYVPPRAGDIKHSWADIALAEKVIGYRPVVSFSDGLQKTIEWYAANR